MQFVPAPDDLPDDHIPHPLYRILFVFTRKLTGEEAQQLVAVIEAHTVSVFLKNLNPTDGDEWDITATSYGPPDVATLARELQTFAAENGFAPFMDENSFHVEKLPEQDWLRHVHDNFPPVHIGRFFVYGSHYDGEIPDGMTPLRIDAATAFGSGEHQTTKGCMIAFEKLRETQTFANALDMGCGSGILAIALAKIFPDIKLTAIDIDPESVTVTARHAAMNDVTLETAAGDGYKTPLCGKNAPYDLIAANILAGPLIDMAPALAAVLQSGGYCVLSGLLARQEDDVTKAHTDAGLTAVDKIAIDDWRALVFTKP